MAEKWIQKAIKKPGAGSNIDDGGRALLEDTAERANRAVKRGNSHEFLRVLAHPRIVSNKSAQSVDTGKNLGLQPLYQNKNQKKRAPEEALSKTTQRGYAPLEAKAPSGSEAPKL